MAMMGSFPKQPGETLPVDIDYSAVIAGRTVDSLTPTVTTPVGLTKVSEQVSGNVLQLYLSGGTAGQTYKWTISTAIVIGGRTTVVEDEFITLVEEV
ncbi:phage fiber-tail adaptor protein [Aquariibacter albus]|uniref:Uncharacterized protein n=1 Tax=Aquariibacter albus TaxID=2759899 RepID=A0A839HPF0_9BURK|nr:hypothetical protein [Aquariibacter albus]MBB1161468.1 hypothetical protein [Aquariibacter albus]